jgi:hypothetical protein
MSNTFSFEEQPFEAHSDFDEEETEFEQENVDSGLAVSEWEEEIRRGTTGYRQPGRQPRPMPNRLWPPKHPLRGYSPPERLLFVDYRIEGQPASCTSPAQATKFVRWVQSSLNEVLGLRLPVTGIMNAATRSAVRGFQEQHGPTANGIAGPETEQALVAGVR